MLIEFHRPDVSDDVVGTARWKGRTVEIVSEDESVRTALLRVFRATPVSTDDASYRRQGTQGEVVLQPGSFEWFRAAAFARASEAGLVARVVPGVREGGWDPASQYRTFDESIERLETQ